MKNSLEHHRTLDERLVNVAKTIKVLNSLAWPVEAAKSFLKDYKSETPALPNIVYAEVRYNAEKEELQAIMESCDRRSPMGEFLYLTAESYVMAVDMLENRGNPKFKELSLELYGGPRDVIEGQKTTTLSAADHFLQFSKRYAKAGQVAEEEVCLLADYVAGEIQKAVDSLFTRHRVRVVVDSTLASKAAAGAERIRIRGYTCFSEIDIPQLIEHEAFVHTLTLLNGRSQPILRSLGLGAPRTTKTQEGLALFGELITTAMDINRLRRISARVKAIDMALEGADFVEIFKYFRKTGQTKFESFQSATRVFRGGDVRGGIAFTKDVVYLEGFLKVHSFFQRSMESEDYTYPHYLFSGRLTTDDVQALEEYFVDKMIISPVYEPKWMKNRSSLVAFLVYSNFLGDLKASTTNGANGG